jgi:hypothetical protein
MSSPDPPRPPFGWILGTGRCGSTLVHEVLARHPGTGFISNVEDRVAAPAWTGRWNGTLFRQVPDRFTDKGRLRYAPSEAYRLLEREVSPLLVDPCRDLVAGDVTPWVAERFHRTFLGRAQAQAPAVFVHKFTGWPRARFVEAVLPGSKFVHVVRDGRAVANSWLQMEWWHGHRGPAEWLFGPLPDAYRDEWEASGRSFVLLAGLAWKLLVDAFEAARRDLAPEQWLEVRYEDVLAEPRATFATILEFLGLPADRRFDQALARYEFRPSRTNAFVRDLDPAGLQLLETSLAGHLHRFGYSVAEGVAGGATGSAHGRAGAPAHHTSPVAQVVATG